jgi:hypothetical protein
MNISRWAKEHGSLVVSASSLFIASLSLYFTIQAQKTDINYKELSIRPKLQWRSSATDFSINLDNVGLGPATIETFGMRVEGKCVDISRLETDAAGMDRKMRTVLEDTVVAALGREILDIFICILTSQFVEKR